MDYCNAFLGKTIEKLTIEDIKEYFKVARIETDQIEFKSISNKSITAVEFKPIQRAICAFLNSNGGVIIWGAPVNTDTSGNSNLTYFEGVVNTDYIVSKISDTILPLPNNIRVQVITENGNNIVIIEVQQSLYPPHQFLNIYYLRLDGQSKPAPHHYIEALFKKIKYPDIEAYLKIKSLSVNEEHSGYILKYDIVFFNWTNYQNEENLYYTILITDGVFKNPVSNSEESYYSNQGRKYSNQNVKNIFYSMEPIIESNQIVFTREALKATDFKSRILIAFGGRFSPLKFCNYKLDLSTLNCDKIIIEKIENVFSHEKHEGKTKEQIVTEFLSSLY